jgi:hypothetical protein
MTLANDVCFEQTKTLRIFIIPGVYYFFLSFVLLTLSNFVFIKH